MHCIPEPARASLIMMCQQSIHTVRVYKYFIHVMPDPVGTINPHIIAQVQPSHQAKVVIDPINPPPAPQTYDGCMPVFFEKGGSRRVMFVYFSCFDETVSSFDASEVLPHNYCTANLEISCNQSVHSPGIGISALLQQPLATHQVNALSRTKG